MEAEADVVVVGAGLAGLACALHLHRAGLAVTVLEASDGVGGRVRTDVVDGWRLDRGFQVHDTAYPEVARLVDEKALRLQAFTPGALIHLGGRWHRVADPRRRPLQAPATLRAGIGSLGDKLRLAALAVRTALTPAQRLLAQPETTTYDALRGAGLSDTVIDRFWRPYLSGVFLEDELRTSSRFFALVLRSQARGTQCLPADGIGAIPAQLATALPARTVELDTPVERLAGTTATTAAGPRRARAVVVATDPATAGALLPGLPVPRLNPVTTVYLAAPGHPTEPVIRLEGEGRTRGPLVNAVVLPSRQPGVLLAASALGAAVGVPEVRNHLRQWHGPQVDEWEVLGRYTAYGVDMGAPQGRLRRPVRWGDGVYVCGDHRDSASTQGACVSGRRAAAAVLQDLAS